jgi:hypothetical protein
LLTIPRPVMFIVLGALLLAFALGAVLMAASAASVSPGDGKVPLAVKSRR